MKWICEHIAFSLPSREMGYECLWESIWMLVACTRVVVMRVEKSNEIQEILIAGTQWATGGWG